VSPSDARNPTYVYTRRFFQALSEGGLRHVCISPGSRSAPLAVSADWQPELTTWVHIDERCSAFFALGLARASGEPVALVCTSGTAAANYLPAVVEANHARIPLILLTADRPPELRDWDAGQTIDQLKLYGSQVRWFSELPIADGGTPRLRHAASVAARALAEARGHTGAPGPVHLNWPLREPLEPSATDLSGRSSARDSAGRVGFEAVRPAAPAAEATIDSLLALARSESRGLIVCGPLDAGQGEADALCALAEATGWPLVADPASNVRAGSHVNTSSPVIATGDFLARCGGFAKAHAPDVVVRFGSTPTSKALRLWLERHPPREFIVVDPHGGISDPSHLATRVLAVDPVRLCRAWARGLAAPSQRPWLASWRRADVGAREAAQAALLDDDRLLELRAVRELWDSLPDGALLYVSNSMPIRHLDACMPVESRRVRVLANRGANGIDGMVSSAFGAAAAGVGRTVLLTGDLAFVHDLGGLLAGRHGLDLTIVVLDNDGGGIFSFLPIAAAGESVHFKELFRTPHGLDLSRAAALFGADYARVETLSHHRAALKEALAREGVSIVHVVVDGAASVEQFRAVAAAAAGGAENASS
jgi:2-succinyl-5-enolpyruvyl-6-hydroxy-3-cyclohexene-1-carboxylate synthase